MSIDKFGRYLHNNKKNNNINVEIRNLIQNFIRIIQFIPLVAHNIPEIDLNDNEQFKAMSDPQLLSKYEKYAAETAQPWFFRAWFDEKFIYKHEV